MNDSKKKSQILIIITIAVFGIAIISATYAFFTVGAHIDNFNVNIETEGMTYTFVAESGNDISLPINALDMSKQNISVEKLKSTNSSINVSLASPYEGKTSVCTYDIVWIWDEGDKYTTPDATLPYTNPEDGKVYPYEFSAMVDGKYEQDFSNLQASGNTITLKSDESMVSTSLTPTERTYNIAFSIYNLPVDQQNLFNKKFNAHVTVDNVECKVVEDETNYSMNLAGYVKEVVYSLNQNGTDPSGTAGVYYHDGKGTYTSADLEAGDYLYRYTGAYSDVNNYVCFQGDDCTNESYLYRIISVDAKTNQVKLVKKSSYSGSSYWNNNNSYTAKDGDLGLVPGTTYTNIWAMPNGDGTYYTSSLSDTLNSTYLTSLGENANLIVDTVWSVGGVSEALSKSPNNVKLFMEMEHNNSVTYKSKIGLMYGSEWGYASLPSAWNIDLYTNNTYHGGWFPTNSFTITRVSDSASNSFYSYSSTSKYSLRTTSSSNGVYPTFSLKSNVRIMNAGSADLGSQGNPMKIAG